MKITFHGLELRQPEGGKSMLKGFGHWKFQEAQDFFVLFFGSGDSEYFLLFFKKTFVEETLKAKTDLCI